MGYNTDFKGQIQIEPPLNEHEWAYWTKFAEDDHREDKSLPSAYCQWIPNIAGDAIIWDGNEKFYESDKWMKHIVSQLKETGHKCNGTIIAQGEDIDDRWKLIVNDNNVTTQQLE